MKIKNNRLAIGIIFTVLSIAIIFSLINFSQNTNVSALSTSNNSKSTKFTNNATSLTKKIKTPKVFGNFEETKKKTLKPSIKKVLPSVGSTNGKTKVKITGKNFRITYKVKKRTKVAKPVVKFGGTKCIVKKIAKTYITCVTGKHKAGKVSVVVKTRNGTATKRKGFTYRKPIPKPKTITRTLTYKSNGGTGSMGVSTCKTTGKSCQVTISSNRFTAPQGKTFDGWNAKADGKGVTYVAGRKVTLSSNLTVYAKWKEIVYKITYVSGVNGSISGCSPLTYTINSRFPIVPDCSTKTANEGFSFDELTGDTTITKSSLGNKTVTAKWNAYTVTVFFSPGAGTGDADPQILPYSGTVANPTNPPTKENYTLVSWKTHSEIIWSFGPGGTTLTADHGVLISEEYKTGSLVLIAQWGINPTVGTITANTGKINSQQISIRIYGKDFGKDSNFWDVSSTKVLFGGVQGVANSITEVHVSIGFYLTVTPPISSTKGPVDVTVINGSGGIKTIQNGYTYTDANSPMTMQTFTQADCNSTNFPNPLTKDNYNTQIPTIISLKDVRDNNYYTIMRVVGTNYNKCWMTRDLDLSLANNTKLTPDYSDVTDDWIVPPGTELTALEQDMSDTGPSSISGNLNSTSDIDKGRHYYNFMAATAGSTNSVDDNITESICPKGWKLPTGGTTSGQFKELFGALGGTRMDGEVLYPIGGYHRNSDYNDGLAFGNNGLYFKDDDNKSKFGGADFGFWWSSTIVPNDLSVGKLFERNNRTSQENPKYFLNQITEKRDGLPVRCVVADS
jgi:uncharacterized protein (TIGR02145 family)/uncharacterized repeat protein (TIGR02543 family)